MRYLFLLLLVLCGCANMPFEIRDVRVYDNLEIQRGQLKSCDMLVRDVVTLRYNKNEGFDRQEHVCGPVTCDNRSKIPTLDPITCVPFEEVRVDRPKTRPTGKGAF